MYAKGVTSVHPLPETRGPPSHPNQGEDEVGVLDLADPTPGLALTPPSWLPSSVAGLAGFAGTPTPSPPGTGGELAWGIRRRPASGPRISLHPFPSHSRRASGSGEPRPSARLGPFFPCRPGPSSRSWGWAGRVGTSPLLRQGALGAAKRGRERVKQGAGGGSGGWERRESESGGGGGGARAKEHPVPAAGCARGGGGAGSNRRRGGKTGEAGGGRSLGLRPTPSPPSAGGTDPFASLGFRRLFPASPRLRRRHELLKRPASLVPGPGYARAWTAGSRSAWGPRQGAGCPQTCTSPLSAGAAHTCRASPVHLESRAYSVAFSSDGALPYSRRVLIDPFSGGGN